MTASRASLFLRSHVVVATALVIGACAHGASVGSGGAGGGIGGGGGQVVKTGTVASETSSPSVGTTASAGGAPSATTTDAATATDTGATTSTGPAPCDPTPANMCTSAMVATSVSGDNGGMTNTSGAGSAWIRVQITEDNSSIFPAGLSYTATLSSPPGTVYNLSVIEGSTGGSPSCAGSGTAGTPAGGSVQSVHQSWGDSLGSDDSRWLSILVQLQSGTDCTTPWSLQIVGAT